MTENIMFFRSNLPKYHCPWCESDLLDVGITYNKALDYVYDKKVKKMMLSREYVADYPICGLCDKKLPYNVAAKVEKELTWEE